MRTLVVNVSRLLTLYVFHIRPAATIPSATMALFTHCALVKTMNCSLLRCRKTNVTNGSDLLQSHGSSGRYLLLI